MSIKSCFWKEYWISDAPEIEHQIGNAQEMVHHIQCILEKLSCKCTTVIYAYPLILYNMVQWLTKVKNCMYFYLYK